MRPYEAIFDDGKHIKDAKDLKFCCKCGLTALSKKGDLIKCDTCNDFWHTDCLDQPTTAPPQTWQATEKKGNRTVDVYKKRYWECPRHVDQDIVFYTDPSTYGGNPLSVRGIRARLPRRQVAQAGSLRPTAPVLKKVREAPADTMLINIEVDDAWWETYEKRMNDMKETGNTSFLVHENSIIADFAHKTRRYVLRSSVSNAIKILIINSNGVALAQSTEDLIDAACPNPAKRAGLKQQWREREQAQVAARAQAEIAAAQAEMDDMVKKEVEVALLLHEMQHSKDVPSVSTLLAQESDDFAVDQLAATMTQDQIKRMQALLEAASKKMNAYPASALAQTNAELDGDMDAILAGGKTTVANSVVSDSEEPVSKRRRKDSTPCYDSPPKDVKRRRKSSTPTYDLKTGKDVERRRQSSTPTYDPEDVKRETSMGWPTVAVDGGKDNPVEIADDETSDDE